MLPCLLLSNPFADSLSLTMLAFAALSLLLCAAGRVTFAFTDGKLQTFLNLVFSVIISYNGSFF